MYTTGKHTHERTNERATEKNHVHFVRCHFAVTFLRLLTRYILRLAFALSPPAPTNGSLFRRHAQDFIPFYKSNINTNVLYKSINVNVSKFTASFTCHLFFDLLICNQIFLNYGFYGARSLL